MAGDPGKGGERARRRQGSRAPAGSVVEGSLLLLAEAVRDGQRELRRGEGGRSREVPSSQRLHSAQLTYSPTPVP